MKVVITGASGLVGSALVSSLEGAGNEVIRLVRRAPQNEHERHWEPSGEPNPALVEGVDAVVHLAAETISGWWTEKKKKRILDSRVTGTEMIARSIAQAQQKPKVFISASGAGYYGHRKDEVLTEESSSGNTFLAELARQWEAATKPASAAGVRVVLLRIGVVLSMNGGALPQMLPPFRMGLGGKVGSGKQYWPWITLEDIVRVIRFSLITEAVSGPVNVVAPQQTTNKEFTKALGRVLKRPTIFPLPGVAVTLMLGEMGQEALLVSERVEPAKLKNLGFVYRHPQIDEALADVMAKREKAH
ncbi:MAG TPA: TIGR01777 family oxidoreductase [Terriglobales bacterium]|nr:TIGR01777 family oxidoreductase [Terriglobales bacterium]